MFKNFRSVLLAGMVAVGVAACGDDVTVVEPPAPPPPPTPTVKSISVTPDGASVGVGQTIVMSAAVVADEGVATTVTWSSSDPTKATVNAATGVVTGVAVGAVGIKATSTVNPAVSGNATITVVAAPAVATISIAAVNNAAGAPVLLAAVAGQINAVLNLDRGGETVTGIDLLLCGKVVGSQNFAAPSADDADVQAAVEQITIPVNTAAFDPITGVPTCFNGPTTLQARVRTATNAQGTASPSLNLTLANVNTVAPTVALTGGFAPVNSAAGLQWSRGGLTVSVLPVIYTPGLTLGAGSVGSATFGTFGCDASGIGPRTASLTAPAAGSFAWTATFSNTATAAATNVTNYELSAAGCPGTTLTGEGITVSMNSGGNQVLAGVTVGLGLRLDNRGPSAPTFVANPVLRQNGWINATVGLVGQNGTSAFPGVPSATDNDWTANGATADAGVGGYVRNLRVGTGGGTVANANGTAASAAPALPAPSATNITYCGVITAADLLGNESTLPANATACLAPPFAAFQNTLSQHLQFGVDVAAPTIAFSGGLAANARINAAAAGAEFQVTVADTGAVGNSGMLSGAAVIGNILRRSAAGTTCFLGSGASCAQVSVNAAPPFPLVPTTTVAAGALASAYFTYTARSQDAAGNQSADVTRVVVVDNVAPTVSNPAVPVTITGAFSASAFINDDLSIRDYFWTAGFGGGLTAPATITLAAAPTVVDAFNAATLTNVNFAINTPINTFLGLQATAAGVPQAYAANSAPLNQVNLFARDQTSAYVAGTSAVAPTAPATGVSITNFNLYNAATSAATICVGTAAACGATPTAATWTAVATGTTAVFNNPFSRVDFYAADAAGANLILIGSVAAGSATLVDNGATRVWTYSFPVTAASLYTTLGGVQPAVVGPVNVYAFGVNAAGNVALVSAAVAQTINP